MPPQPVTDLALDAIADRLGAVRARVARAAETAGRDPASVLLLAVTKGHGVDAVTAAARLGLGDVGESRVQEAQAKIDAYRGAALSWHMVGHLQRNKAGAAARLFDTVHSVDSAALAGVLARHRPGDRPPLRVFVEVELTGIAGRSGVTPAAAAALLTHVRGLPALAVRGLMTIAPPGSAEAASACFARLHQLRAVLEHDQGFSLPGLSMGMSNDFEVAIAHGATVIRLGRVLFGDRPGGGA
jgi:pyridoxal phosphate enzyme (YggS family)